VIFDVEQGEIFTASVETDATEILDDDIKELCKGVDMDISDVWQVYLFNGRLLDSRDG
jgi:hypothetical protein